MLIKRDSDEDTWLIIAGTVGLFVFLALLWLGIWCCRKRSLKRITDKRRNITKMNGQKYTKLDEEKAESTEIVTQPTPLPAAVQPIATHLQGSGSNSARSSSPESRLSSIPPSTQMSGAIIEHVPRSETPSRFSSLKIPTHGDGLFLPPPTNSHHSSRRNSAPSSVDEHEHDHEYDGRTGQRYDRSRSPSPHHLLLSRSASMLRPQ